MNSAASARFARGAGIPGRVWATGWPEWLERLPAGSDLPRVSAAVAVGLHAAFRRAGAAGKRGLPRRAGVLSPRFARPPDGDLLAMMMAVATQLALFLRRVRAESDLARDHNLLRAVIDNLPDHIYLKDASGRYVVDNAAHTRFLGLPGPEAVVGKTVFDFFPAELAGHFTDDDQVVLASGRPIINREEPIRGADGTPGFVATSKLPFRDAAGKIVGLVCVSRDISAQRQAEADLHTAQLQLIQAEKLESLGRLAAGIAHEVKNPLAVITMGIDYLAGDVEAAGEAADPNARRKSSIQCGKASAGPTRSCARCWIFPRPDRWKSARKTSMNSSPAPCRWSATNLIVAAVQVEAHLEKDLPPVALDRDKILQVLINLFTNAAHAMRETTRGGRGPAP